jgi:tRNA (guanine-N7-)-methyltransferase
VSVRKSVRLPIEELAPYVVEAPPIVEGQPTPQLDWPTIFGNGNPVEIEVGFGKGLFLLTESEARPDTNFLGIEIVRKYQLFTANRIAKRCRRNVKVTCAEANGFLRHFIAENSVEQVHVYFPDPWWKTRHHKRRLFTEDFALNCLRILRPGAQLWVATDVPDYAAMVREVVAHTPFLPAAPPTEHEATHDMDYLTNFERRFRKEGKPIHRMAYHKPGGGQ